MKAIKPIILALSLTLLFVAASDTQAQVSNAAALFLRIAPGARAAGMGEAFVAVADDATATHWNPAGLGASPLANNWNVATIPERYRPIRGVAALRRGKGSGSGYRAYDLWLLTAKGLMRYDNKQWHTAETFETRTTQTVRRIVSSYLNLSSEELIDAVIDEVASANFDVTYDYLSTMRETILSSMPEGYGPAEQVELGLDSLLICFRLCRLDYDRVRRLEDVFAKSYKDSAFSNEEMDRLDFSIERSRTRFIPEELKLPYNAFATGEITSIASNGDALLVGTSDGLLQYSGRRWNRMTVESGLPHPSVTTLETVGNTIFVGTMDGVAAFNGIRLDPIAATNALPAGEVEAIGAQDRNNIYVAINRDLYHYDGQTWSNSFPYTIQIEDSADDLADRFNIFGSEVERQEYLAKLQQFQPGGAVDNTEEGAGGDSTTVNPWFQPGAVIHVPYVASLPGRVSAIFVDAQGDLWIGTEYGVLRLADDKWTTPGYREVTLAEGQTIEDVASQRRLTGSDQLSTYAELLRTVNRIGDEGAEAGTTIRIVKSPAAAATTDISGGGLGVFFATETGMLEFDSEGWSRSDVSGMGRVPTLAIVSLPDETWYVSSEKVATMSPGRLELSGTHVNWLPELADDLTYDFGSLVFNLGRLGTFGLSATFISFGTIERTDEQGNSLGSFDSFDAAFTASYGTSLSDRWKGGMSVKVIHSRLADQGTGQEKGKGIATGFALDFGVLYMASPRLTLGAALTNLGPKLAYIDAAQADDIPRNIAVGFAYKLVESEYSSLLVTAEVNKILVGLRDGLSREFDEAIFNSGIEYTYANLFALRGGYIFDREGQVKTFTLGAGLKFLDIARADFSYIPSSSGQALANTLRLSLSVNP